MHSRISTKLRLRHNPWQVACFERRAFRRDCISFTVYLSALGHSLVDFYASAVPWTVRTRRRRTMHPPASVPYTVPSASGSPAPSSSPISPSRSPQPSPTMPSPTPATSPTGPSSSVSHAGAGVPYHISRSRGCCRCHWAVFSVFFFPRARLSVSRKECRVVPANIPIHSGCNN